LFAVNRQNNERKRYIMKKRILTLVTALVLVFSLVACGKPSTLAELVESKAWKTELQSINDEAEAMGMSVSTEADGNTLVFKYFLPDEEIYNALTAEDGEYMVDVLVETFKSGDMLAQFEAEFDVPIDAIRVGYYKADGTELGSSEITKETAE